MYSDHESGLWSSTGAESSFEVPSGLSSQGCSFVDAYQFKPLFNINGQPISNVNISAQGCPSNHLHTDIPVEALLNAPSPAIGKDENPFIATNFYTPETTVSFNTIGTKDMAVASSWALYSTSTTQLAAIQSFQNPHNIPNLPIPPYISQLAAAPISPVPLFTTTYLNTDLGFEKVNDLLCVSHTGFKPAVFEAITPAGQAIPQNQNFSLFGSKEPISGQLSQLNHHRIVQRENPKEVSVKFKKRYQSNRRKQLTALVYEQIQPKGRRDQTNTEGKATLDVGNAA